MAERYKKTRVLLNSIGVVSMLGGLVFAEVPFFDTLHYFGTHPNPDFDQLWNTKGSYHNETIGSEWVDSLDSVFSGAFLVGFADYLKQEGKSKE